MDADHPRNLESFARCFTDFAVHQRLQKENDALQQLLGDKFLRFQQHIEHFDTGAAAALLDEALAAL